MVAGLFVLVTTSCSEKKTTETDAAKAKSEETAEAKSPDAAEDPSDVAPEAAPSAYYVMFKGDGGWGVGNRARAALQAIDGVDSVILSGLRATVKLKEGATIDEKLVTEALEKKKLAFVSKSAVPDEAPKVVYVLSVSGVGWSDTEEKARVALTEVENVTNVYVGKTTEIWMSEGGSLEKEAVTTMLQGFGFKLAEMEKTDKSTL